jgi:hypothetical protein
MKPIDTIRSKIDSDLSKYHGFTLCAIRSDEDVFDIKGIGVVAIVTPMNASDSFDPLTTGKDYRFPVHIINRSSKSIESEVSERYFVLTLNMSQDKPSSSVGFLVSKTFLPDVLDFKEIKDSYGRPLNTMQRENIIDDKTG